VPTAVAPLSAMPSSKHRQWQAASRLAAAVWGRPTFGLAVLPV